MKVQSGNCQSYLFHLIILIAKYIVKIAFDLVVGDLKPSDLGLTLTHEHLSLDFDNFFYPSPDHLKEYVAGPTITLGNLGVLRQYPYASRYNLKFNDNDTHEKVIEDLHLFKNWCRGKCTIVENTSHGIIRNLRFYREAAQKTGVNVIAGTGHYVDMSQNTSDLALSLEQLTDLYTRELISGVDVSDAGDGSDIIKCGFIGEVGSGWPITGEYFVFKLLYY